MKKTVKMVLYGAPGVGKSTFASKCPNPLFLCTDGNYEWLDLPEENHIDLTSWDHAKKVFAELGSPKYEKFETIVIDLAEDLYSWAEREFCKAHKIEHIGDYKSFGAGYALVRDEFFVEICKLITLPKHIILLSHELLKVEKDRKGSEHHKFYPSDKMSIDKLWTPIEGRVRYFLRAYMASEEVNTKVVKKRYLSIVPKENEFGIARGIDESAIPEDIVLDWDVFCGVIGIDSEPVEKPESKPVPKIEVPKEVPVVEETKKQRAPRKPKEETPKEEPVLVKEVPVVEETPVEPKQEEIEDVVSKLKELVDVNDIVVEEDKPEPVAETPTMNITCDADLTEDVLRNCINQGMRINDIETTYGFKCSAKVKMAYIKIKNEMTK